MSGSHISADLSDVIGPVSEAFEIYHERSHLLANRDGDRQENEGRPGRCSSCAAWLSSNAALIYICQFLAAWGDRMWTFAVALYLVEIENNSLRLTAIFGFALTISVMLFGALVGKWVDRTPRLSATSRSLLVQNIGIILSATCLVLLLHYKPEVEKIGGGAVYILCQLVIVSLGVVANLASVAEKICIERDWVVILAGGDTDKLSEMNSVVRRIDLTVNILAPVLVGQIMTFISMTVAGIFIAAWSLVSLVVEYFLLLRIYKRVPRLATKFTNKEEDETQPDVAETPADVTSADVTSADEVPEDSTDSQSSGGSGFLWRVKDWLLSTYHGWQIFKSYQIYLAGLALAFLYMTVMGFDSITNSYGFAMGLSQATLGGILAMGSVAGIIGTFAYPRLRQRIGTTRTGLYSLSEEILCLSLCVLSVWAPGSPFDPDYFFPKGSNSTTMQPITSIPTTLPPSTLTSRPPQSGLLSNTSGLFAYGEPPVKGALMATMTSLFEGGDTSQTTPTASPPKALIDYASPILFFAGMVLSRIGLWMFDLVVSQLIQENVHESERGIFNGMQRSLENLMDMLHFILVIVLPSPATFGYLICLSFLFICTGAALYCVFAFRDRGHLFHPEKLTLCLKPTPKRSLEENPAV